MASFLPLADRDFWSAALKADAEFRACMEQVVGALDAEIDVPKLELAFNLSAAINVRIDALNVRRSAIVAEVPGIDIILSFLASRANPEAVAFAQAMAARKALLLSEQAGIDAQIAVLPGFSASTKEATDNLITAGKNASFLSGILDDVALEGG